VDASVFPKIPGLFILSAVFMIGEKAADVILHGPQEIAQAGWLKKLLLWIFGKS
jgi:choline dehydrogenase-like flavoprotein